METKMKRFTLIVALVFVLTACSSQATYELPDPQVNPEPLGQPGTLIEPLYVPDTFSDWKSVGTYEAQTSLEDEAWSYFRKNTGGYNGKHFLGLYEKTENIMHLISLYVYDNEQVVHVAHNFEKGFWVKFPEQGNALFVGLLEGNTYMVRKVDQEWQARLATE
jgi:hypothetical protein